MHIHPEISPDFKPRHTDDAQEFVHLFKELHMDYVVAADFPATTGRGCAGWTISLLEEEVLACTRPEGNSFTMPSP